MTRKKGQGNYDPDFKLEAARLVVDQGYSIREAAEAMSVGKSTMDKWVRQLNQENKGISPNSSPLTPEQRRIRELEQQLRKTEREKEIFKRLLLS